MEQPSTLNELLRLEQRYWQAMKDRDAQTAAGLSADPCLVTGAQGVARLDRATLTRTFEDAAWKLESFELTKFDVELLTSDVAVVVYEVRESVTVGDQRLSFDAADSSTWVFREGRWLCAAHAEALSGDPFGRDRRPRA